MSLTLVFTPDAKIDGREMGIAQQEVVLDELEDLAETRDAPEDDYELLHEVRSVESGGTRYALVRLAVVAGDRALIVPGMSSSR